MPYIQLCDIRTSEERVFEEDTVRIGRAPDQELVPAGPGSEVVSGRHAQLTYEAERWWVEDLESRNGTFLDTQALPPGVKHPLTRGIVIGLGVGGPRLRVEATEKRVEGTAVELPPGLDEDSTVPMVPPEAIPQPARKVSSSGEAAGAAAAAKIKLKLRETRDGLEYKVAGGRIRLGRGGECEVRPIRDGDTLVSRVHAEITLSPDNRAVLRDSRSRNGTFVNHVRLAGQHELRQGDQIELGHGGPVLVVELLVLPEPVPAAPGEAAAAAGASAPARRSFGGKGRTRYMRELIDETAKKSSARLRGVVVSAAVVLLAAVAVAYWYSERRVRETAAALEEATAALVLQQARADSLRGEAEADRQRLRAELAEARRASAPASVVDSLREALEAATARTQALEQSLQRAERELSAQLAAAESLRVAQEGEAARIGAELVLASQADLSQDLLDSLRQAMRDAERQASELGAHVRAVRGVDLAAVAQANQGAVGLISAHVGGAVYTGSGFVISRAGHMITNRHVVAPDGRRSDSVFVTMADRRVRQAASIDAILQPPGADVALLRISGYDGPHVESVDWSGARVRQGEPAALIGFPSGFDVALDLSATVRTSMTAGIFSKVTDEVVQFDGFTVGGSSGSPIFNAAGEVVAVHRAGLAEAAGLAFGVPIGQVVPLLPPDLRVELNLAGR